MLTTIDKNKSGLKEFGEEGETRYFFQACIHPDVGLDGTAATIHKGFLLPAASCFHGLQLQSAHAKWSNAMKQKQLCSDKKGSHCKQTRISWELFNILTHNYLIVAKNIFESEINHNSRSSSTKLTANKYSLLVLGLKSYSPNKIQIKTSILLGCAWKYTKQGGVQNHAKYAKLGQQFCIPFKYKNGIM